MSEMKRDIADAMADVIVEQVKARGEYSIDDFLKANFTMAEIRRYEALAYGYATGTFRDDGFAVTIERKVGAMNAGKLTACITHSANHRRKILARRLVQQIGMKAD